MRKSFDTSHFLKKVKKVSALTPEDFLEKLEADGFKLREENGRLFIGPNSRLADLDRGSVDRLREGLLALLRDRAQLDAKARCWKCNYRRCSKCSRSTDSAFIELCNHCVLKPEAQP